MFKFLSITCKEAHEICNKAQYNEASFVEKIKLNIHIITCKICALYVKQNATLTQVLKGKAMDCKTKEHCMSNEDKELLKEQLKKEMSS